MAAAVKEYRQVWTSDPRLTPIGLSRYFGRGTGPPPEVEEGHFGAIFADVARGRGIAPAELERRYRAGELDIPELDLFFEHDRCVRESGHDTTYRWYEEPVGDHCADFVTVDLNSLLYKYEIDIAETIRTHFPGGLALPDGTKETAKTWIRKAQDRKTRILKYLWDHDAAMFFDYDFKRGRARRYWSPTSLYPLWAVDPDRPETRLLDEVQAERLVRATLPGLEQPGGLSASACELLPIAREKLGERQWDYPNGWPPHQMLAWEGLANYGFGEDAEAPAYRWLFTMVHNAYWYNGTIPEKYDVVSRSHRVFSEYGNVGTDFDYITREGFGWMNASFKVGLKYLSERNREHLDRLTPPEWLFSRRTAPGCE